MLYFLLLSGSAFLILTAAEMELIKPAHHGALEVLAVVTLMSGHVCGLQVFLRRSHAQRQLNRHMRLLNDVLRPHLTIVGHKRWLLRRLKVP